MCLLRWGLLAACLHAALAEDAYSVCSAEGLSKEACLTRGKCMYIEFEDAPSRCTVCEGFGAQLPCAPVGGIYAGHTVKECAMQCGHQTVLQEVSACEDTTGDITLAQCFAKGSSALTKCMWTQESLTKGFCGPCSVAGVGTIPCPPGGALGMSPGGIVTMCVSQCDDACPPMLPGCDINTPPPPPLLNGPVPLSSLKIQMDKDAPDYIAIKVLPPYDKKEYENAARIAAQVAMWGPKTLQAPSAPLAIYGPPPVEGPSLPPGLPVLYGPAPPGMPGVPPPGYGYGTAPPPAMVEASKAFLQESEESQKSRGRPLLRHGAKRL